MVHKVYEKNVFFLVTKHPVYLWNLGLDAKFKYVAGKSVQVRKILQKPKKFE